MNILFLRGFNNYFNRVIKKYSTLADYQSQSVSYVNFEGINFNPNDGVVTELVLGNESQKENSLPLDWENIGTPDYCVCYENNNIVSRWFILESERLRSGQYRLALKRDVVAEHFNTIKVSPCFVEKGIINDTENSLLYNKESMTYNQIKGREFALTDTTECGWIIGYVPKDMPTTSNVLQGGINTTILLEGDPTDYIESDEVPGLTDLLVPGDNTIYRKTLHDALTLHIPTIYNASVTNVYENPFTPTTSTAKAGNYAAVTFSTDQATNQVLDMSSYVGSLSTYEHGNTTSSIASDSGLIANKSGTYYGYSNLLRIKATYKSGAKAMAYDSTTISTPSGSGSNNHDSIFKYSTSAINAMNSHTGSWGSSLTTVSNAINTAMSSYKLCDYEYNDSISNIQALNGKIIKYNGEFYNISVESIGSTVLVYRSTTYMNSDIEVSWSSSAVGTVVPKYYATSAETNLNNLAGGFIAGWTSNVDSNFKTYGSNGTAFATKLYYTYNVTLSRISTETLHVVDRSCDDRAHTYDNSADLFAVPYGEIDFAISNTAPVTKYTTTKARSLAIARAIAARYSTNCYDLQLVPYCPSEIVRNYYATYREMGNNYVPYLGNLDTKSYQIVYDSNENVVGYVLWPTASKDTFDVSEIRVNNTLTQISDLLKPSINYQGVLSDALTYKISNETEVCRLASPNFSGQFEFSIAKNNGVTKFNVDYTYKPYAPYIHVNPDFKFIYGQDWDDARGLICGGDFSLNHITSYWQTYMNNNKNYQQIFDRQIQNMDVNNSIALEKQEFQATVGTITGALGGAMGGAVAGATAGSAAGPWGALIGGVVGAVGGGVGSGLASAYGAEKDRDWLLRQQQEARSYAIDMYGYQLGNIQAMPYSIKGSDSLTNNNKIWPIVEIYEPTLNEVELLKSKIEFNGMTIMAVGKLQDYCTSEDFDKVFIKGQLIRLESDEIQDDFHIADAIYQEINKGVYIPSGGL